jgi:folate-dependent phosphoribosylglycinamide formyltransferase PurN
MSQFICFLDDANTPTIALAGHRILEKSVDGLAFKVIQSIPAGIPLFEGELVHELGSSMWVRKEDGVMVHSIDTRKIEEHESFDAGIVWDEIELFRI